MLLTLPFRLMLLTAAVLSACLLLAGFDLERWQWLTRVRLEVPRAAVLSPVARFPLSIETWTIDPWETGVGHFQGTAWLPRTGNIVIGGHVAYPDGQPAVFAHLAQVRIGDTVRLRVGELSHDYQVIETRLVDYDDLTVLYPSPDERLTLLTCDPASYNPATDRYNQRLVVVAQRFVP